MPGDYVGMGRSYLIGDRDGGWNAYATARSATGLVDDVRIQFTGEGINFWTAWFSTAKLGIPMQPGLYLNAQRNPFQQDGHPGLDIGGEGRGCNELDGAFRVLDAEFDYATERPRVVRFAAVFEQYCEHVTAPLRGAVLYGYSLDWPVRIVSLSPLTEAYVGLWYEHAIIADGGSPPYSFSLIQGGLPPGLALDPDGTLRGTPGSTGLFEFSIRVTDGTGNWSVRELELNVIDALTVTSVPLPAAIRGQPFHCVLTASGGTPPYKWAYADGLYGRQLPAGLSMSPDGVIEGIPIVSSVQYFPVRVTDARFRTVTVDFALEVYMPDGLLGRKELTMTSESGDWVGQGLSYSYDDRYGKWEVNASDLSGDGSVDGVEISLWPAGTVRDFWSLSFSTAKAGVALAPGTYANAQRTPFEAVGFPGMSVSGLGRGCNMLTGTFTVLDAVFDYSEPSPSVVSFAATFEQYCDGRAVPLRGKIAYGSVK